ncbi:MAG TPA: AsmA family protein, partial [Gammaproteobacteria bacterium]|nr:AsmA family protein [Gammaproteobacteria bacterium]
MKLMKILAYVLAAVVALLIVGLALLVLLFDPNDYKDDLARVVEKETGRQLTLEGDLSLSVFPWIAIELGRASLGDAPGFGDEPFVAIERARLGVRLIPLLSGRVEVGDLLLDQPRLKLVTDARGRNNWDDLAGERPAQEEPPATAEPAVTPTVAS